MNKTLTRLPWQDLTIRIHPLLWILVLIAVGTGDFVEVLTLFILIFVHEMGHITAAWSYGWHIGKLDLLPFGGMFNTNECGSKSAKEELVVAIAGPFNHILLILMSLVFYYNNFWSEPWTEYFIIANLVIAIFNLLPIYPLDGGKILQSGLSYSFSYRFTITFTIYVSMFFSSLLFAGSFLITDNIVHLPLLSIACFLIYLNYDAFKHRDYKFMRFLINRNNTSVSYDFEINKIIVKETETLNKALFKLYKERYNVFEVVNQRGEIISFLPEEKVLEAYFSEFKPVTVIKEII